MARDHRQFLHSTWLNTNTYYVAPTDRQSLLYFPGFTASVPNIYDTLLNGATLCSLNPRNLAASALLNWLRQERITHFNPPIGLWRGLVAAISPGEPWPDLRLITLTGQPLYGKDIRQFQAAFGQDTILLYVLGMTEAGAITQAYIDHTIAATDDSVVPVGYPLADKEIVIHNAMGEPVAPGEMGQITINSAYLSLGYWQDEAETAKRFCALPEAPRHRTFLSNDRGVQRADGNLEFYGRGDSIVKVRGYRVDLAAIEAVLNSHPQLTQAAVVTRPRHDGELSLIAYLCSSKENGAAAPTDHALGAYLAASLPRYMIPERFIWLDAMPLTASGKLDRRSLPPPGTTRPDLGVPFVAPRSVLEQQLADIWAELLGLQAVGVHDNFFELGGDSITVMRMVLQMEQQFHRSVALRQFIFNPTIARLAVLFGPSREDADGEAEQMDEDAAPLDATASAELRRLYDALEDQAEIDRLRDRERARVRPTSRRLRTLRLLLRLPQPVALRLLAGALQQPRVQQYFLPRQTALVQRFWAGLEPPPRQDDLLARCLFFGALNHFGLRAFGPQGKFPLPGWINRPKRAAGGKGSSCWSAIPIRRATSPPSA